MTPFIDDVEIMATGVAIVMGVLALLWTLTAGIGLVVRLLDRAADTPRNRAAASASSEGIPPHHLVAITAAVAEIIEAPHRIVRVSAPAHRGGGWTGQGRAGLLSGGGWPGYRTAERGPLSNRVDEP